MGPKIDPREIEYTVSAGQYGLSIGIAALFLYLAFHYRKSESRQLIFFCLGMVTLVTMPWLGVINDAVIGAYPTIDKEGSLLFYQDGVHKRALFSPIDTLQDPAYRLIGFHLGHLWIVEFFDVFLTSYGAFNAQMLLNLFLNCFFGSIFFRHFGVQRATALLFGLVFGMQLHVFRDIHWYTIEKSSIYCLIAFWLLLEQFAAGRNTKWWLLGLTYLGATWINFYWGILLGILGGCYAVYSFFLEETFRKLLWKGLVSCIFVGIFIAAIQLSLMSGGTTLGTEEQFSQRASLDNFSLATLDWNRMGFWRAINPVLVISAVVAFWKGIIPKRFVVIGGVFALLSFGPILFDNDFCCFAGNEVQNPLYLLFSGLPGLWRFAKPEIFFLMTYFCVGIAAIQIPWNNWSRALLGALWIVGLYSSEGFPYLTTFVKSELASDWHETVFDSK